MNRRSNHVIIAGFGPVGRALADGLERHGMPYTIIDLNAATIARQAMLGRDALCDDARDPRVLQTAGLAKAKALAITMPDAEVALECCRIARDLGPTAIIAVRTRHLSQALQARTLGANITVTEEIETAMAMEDLVTAAVGRVANTDGAVESPALQPAVTHAVRA